MQFIPYVAAMIGLTVAAILEIRHTK